MGSLGIGMVGIGFSIRVMLRVNGVRARACRRQLWR